jgi:hypothetical protein
MEPVQVARMNRTRMELERRIAALEREFGQE